MASRAVALWREADAGFGLTLWVVISSASAISRVATLTWHRSSLRLLANIQPDRSVTSSESQGRPGSRAPFWAQQRPRLLVTGLAKCGAGACGSSYVKISANLFGCSAARNRGTCDNRLNIRLDVLEAAILDGLREQLMAPDLFKIFCEAFHRELNRLRSGDNAARSARHHELERMERRTAASSRWSAKTMRSFVR